MHPLSCPSRVSRQWRHGRRVAVVAPTRQPSRAGACGRARRRDAADALAGARCGCVACRVDSHFFGRVITDQKELLCTSVAFVAGYPYGRTQSQKCDRIPTARSSLNRCRASSTVWFSPESSQPKSGDTLKWYSKKISSTRLESLGDRRISQANYTIKGTPLH